MPNLQNTEQVRVERLGLVKGRGQYLDDLDIKGTLCGHFVRSDLAHARIDSVHVTEAAAAKGVQGVLLAKDLTLRPIPGDLRHGPPAPHMGRPPLADSRVRYVGEPIALVVADSARFAEDAADLVAVDLDPLPPVIDPAQAASDEILLFDDAGTNVVEHSTSGTHRGHDLPVRATVEVRNQKLAPLPLEPLGILVEPQDDYITVWCGHQAPHRLKSQLATLLEMDLDRIRVIVPNVGGGFGSRGMLYPEYVVVAAAAKLIGRPLKWTGTRREDIIGGVHGRSQVHRVELEGNESGRVRRARVEILADVGAYPHNGSMIPTFTQFMATGPYMIEELITETTVVVTNTAPIGTYRGAGRPEATYALERAIDAFARQAGIDPIEVRRINLIPDDMLPIKAPSGALYDSGQYRKALAQALKHIDLDTFRREQQDRLRNKMQPALGFGLAMYLERAGGPLTEGEHASVSIEVDGTLTVGVGAVDTGQGHDELWRRLAGRPFDMDDERIRVLYGDTDLVPGGVGTFASRTTQVCGSVVQRCTNTLFEQAREIAGQMLEISPDDLVARDGRFEVVDHSDKSVGLASIAERAAEQGVSLRAGETWIPGAHTFPYGAHISIVEVDTETGDVRLVRAIAVDDCGNILDPAGVTGQVHGSIAQGFGQSRLEAVQYDNHGQPLTSTLVDYLAPRASDLPPFETSHVVTPAPSNPLGAKGVGESGCIGFPPAMVNAVLDALAHLGISHIDMPLHPSNVWATIQRHKNQALPEEKGLLDENWANGGAREP